MGGIEFIRDLAVVLLVAGVVGWICQRIGLSLVVGYLVAGAIIGPYTPPFQLVTDTDRIQVLSQVGLVFLIFSIGLDLGLPRLRRLGMSVILATVIGAILVFNASRVFGQALGWSSTHILFFSGMLMVSSSAILSKVLQELNATHERSGQLALGVTVLEDTVAVVMLTLLSTLVQFGGEQSPPIAKTIAALTAFMAFLLFVSLLFVPRLLLRLTTSGPAELRTIVVIGMVLMLAWLAARAGYSLALGAFLLGVIVGSTPQKDEIDSVFQGLRDMFGAVFFVAMGMLVDFELLSDVWLLVIGVSIFAIFCRTFATASGLILTGNSIRESIRSGLALTPLGEFSFIIAQMGVAAAVIPKHFYPLAVGSSLLTTLIAPSLIRRSEGISSWVDQHLPLFLREWVKFYHSWLERLERRQQRNILWKLTAPRITRTAIHMFVVSAVILFARPAYNAVYQRLNTEWIPENAFGAVFWGIFALLLVAPLVVIGRNIEAIIMIFAESVTTGSNRQRTLQPVLITVLKTASAVVLMIWLLALLPLGVPVLWAFLIVTGILILASAFFWKRLVYFHSRLEVELRSQLQTALSPHGVAPPILTLLQERKDHWNIQAEEFVLPHFAAAAGKKIADLALRKRFGCSIASIDRHGIVLTNPTADTILYPYDKLLLLGSAGQIDAAVKAMSAIRPDSPAFEIEEFSLETVVVPEGSPRAGKPLFELDPIRQAGVQVTGIERRGHRVLTPSGADHFEGGDELLVLGTPRQINEFEQWLKGEHPAPGPAENELH